MSDNLIFAQQAANRGDVEWTNAFAALVSAAALERIAASLEKLVILKEAVTDEDEFTWTNRGT
jgi:hypothetical protein